MPTLPIGGPQVTVQILLKQPRVIARQLTNLAAKRFVADKILLPGTPDMVAGGAVRFQRSESIFPDRPSEATALRSNFPRSGWTENIFTTVVTQNGLEVPINGLSIRRNQIDQVQRAIVKVANAVVKYVDGLAMNMIVTDAAVITQAGVSWSTVTNDIIGDIALAQKLIRSQNEGYVPNTLVVHDNELLSMIKNTNLRSALPRETSLSNQDHIPVWSGMVAPLLGLEQILVSPNCPSGKAIIIDSTLAGTIADEQPDPQEGYIAYDPNEAGGPGADGQFQFSGLLKPIWTRVYEEEQGSDWIIRGARWPAMWLAEPKAVCVLTGLA